jgi:hypothetical protein
MRVSRILLLTLVASSPLNAGEPRAIKVKQAACGAILRDDFNGPRLDPVRWTASSADPGIRVEVDRGELCIRGTSAEIPDSVLRKNLGVLSRYAGAYSNVFHQVDASLAVRVKMPSGISPEPGGHVVNVHLCGVRCDCYSEILFGECESAPMGIGARLLSPECTSLAHDPRIAPRRYDALRSRRSAIRTLMMD